MVKIRRNLLLQRMSLRMVRTISFFMPLILLLASCERSTLMHSYQPLPDNSWNRTDTLLFSLPVLSEDESFGMLVGLRLTNNYPYEGLILEVAQSCQNPYSNRVDTINYKLTDESGDFTENGMNYFQYESQRIPLNLKKGQKGEIRIRHLMHREVLPGIMDVGIRVFR